MKTRVDKKVQKRIELLRPAQQKRLKKAFLVFIKDEQHTTLHNHKLQGKWEGHRSISFGGDWRAIYYKDDDGVAVFVELGTHSQLYK